MSVEPTATRETPAEVAATAELYTFGELDRYARAPKGTARYWLTRYASFDREEATFHDLVEVALVARFKSAGFRPGSIAAALDAFGRAFGAGRAAVSEMLAREGHALLDTDELGLPDDLLDRLREVWDNHIQPLLDDLDYEGGVAVQWWPAGRNEPIRINPEYGWGLPTIEGTGIRTDILHSYFLGGDPCEEIASGFRRTVQQVDRAIAYERSLGA